MSPHGTKRASCQRRHPTRLAPLLERGQRRTKRPSSMECLTGLGIEPGAPIRPDGLPRRYKSA